MAIHLHKGDLPDTVHLGKSISIDSETMGLKPKRDRLCLVQLSSGDGHAHIVQLEIGKYDAPNLKRILADPQIEKIFHYARFDVAIIKAYLGITCQNVYCTRTVSKLVRTYTDRHGLRDCCRELLGIELNKQQQSSDWGAAKLTQDQLDYAANDVLFLHKIKDALHTMLVREGRVALAQACFDFLPARAELDLAGWSAVDIFEH